jgi:hypothetical protein
MGIHHHPNQEPLLAPPAHSWGEVAPDGVVARVFRVVLGDRVVSFPVAELRRWEHVVGNPETLQIWAGSEWVRIEGRKLTQIREALDNSRLIEVRQNTSSPVVRSGPLIRRISVEKRE